MAATDYHAWPLPDGTDLPFVHLDMAALGGAIDKDLPIVVNDLAAMNALPPLLNLKVLVKSLAYALYVHNGTAWVGQGKAAQYAEFTASFNVAGGYVNWDLGPMTKDATASKGDNAFVNSTAALSGAINFTETGIYSINSYSVPPANAGTFGVFQNLNGSGILTTGWTNGTPSWEVSTSTVSLINAGSYVRFTTVAQNAINPLSTRLRIAKLMAV